MRRVIVSTLLSQRWLSLPWSKSPVFGLWWLPEALLWPSESTQEPLSQQAARSNESWLQLTWQGCCLLEWWLSARN